MQDVTTTAQLEDLWPTLTRSVGLLDRRAAVLMRSSRPVVNGRRVLLLNPYQVWVDKLEEPATARLISAFVSRALGRSVEIEPMLMPEPTPIAPPVEDRVVAPPALAGLLQLRGGHLFVGDVAAMPAADIRGRVEDRLRELRDPDELGDDPAHPRRGLIFDLDADGPFRVFAEFAATGEVSCLVVDLDGDYRRRKGL